MAKARGCSGDVCGNPLRSRQRGLPGPTGGWSVERGSVEQPYIYAFSNTHTTTETRGPFIPSPEERGLLARTKVNGTAWGLAAWRVPAFQPVQYPEAYAYTAACN